jgi:hypothetical protein
MRSLERREGRAVAVRLVRVTAAIAVAVALASCASSNAPRAWLPGPNEVPATAKGAWIEVSVVERSGEAGRERRRTRRCEGEFLAASPESVYVLTMDGVEVVSRSAVASARVALFRSQIGTGALITMGGFLSTASNGLGAVLTGPLWLIVGSIATGSVSREPLHDVPSHTWEEASLYARFPQGLPADFVRTGIRFDPEARPNP